jgi:uncharacterized membrane protein YkvA (DUF1232 family)
MVPIVARIVCKPPVPGWLDDAIVVVMKVSELKADMDAAFRQVDERFEQVDRRLEAVDTRLEAMDRRITD